LSRMKIVPDEDRADEDRADEDRARRKIVGE
jgi:hypothetical protein